MPEDSPQVEDVKQALARLAVAEPTARSRAIVEIASEAIQEVDHAAAFAEADGPAKVARAIELAERTDARELAREGQRALAAFERFGDAATTESNRDGDHYRRAHGMDLMEETKRGDR